MKTPCERIEKNYGGNPCLQSFVSCKSRYSEGERDFATGGLAHPVVRSVFCFLTREDDVLAST